MGEAAPPDQLTGPGTPTAGHWRTVTDPADPALEPFRRLTDAQWRRRVEAEAGLCIAESVQVVERALHTCPAAVQVVVATEHAAERLRPALLAAGATVLVTPAELLADVAGFPVHRGVLAAVARPAPLDPATLVAGARRLAVLEDLNDQANVGTLFRSASALGIDAVLLSPRCADPLYRRSVRTSMGEVFRLPWARLDRWPDDLELVRSGGFTLVGLSPSGTAAPQRPGDDERVAVLVGSEGDGLTGGALAACDRVVRIPMRAGVDSLNVAAAAAVAFATYGLVAAR
jgi:tRNA G18 (ribose-2'-O)-methylase SpoU